MQPLSRGETAHAVRLLISADSLETMSELGRYQVIAAEPVAAKTGDLAGARLAHVVVYDHADTRSVSGLVNLDAGEVVSVELTSAQPALSPLEEERAMEIASADARVKDALSSEDFPLSVLHTWSRKPSERAYTRRSAAVLYGHGARDVTVVAVVDMTGGEVIEVSPADKW